MCFFWACTFNKQRNLCMATSNQTVDCHLNSDLGKLCPYLFKCVGIKGLLHFCWTSHISYQSFNGQSRTILVSYCSEHNMQHVAGWADGAMLSAELLMLQLSSASPLKNNGHFWKSVPENFNVTFLIYLVASRILTRYGIQSKFRSTPKDYIQVDV